MPKVVSVKVPTKKAPAKPARPKKPTKEQLAKVQPWITKMIRDWAREQGDEDVMDTADLALASVFGAPPGPRKPSAADLKAVQPWIVDQIVRWGRENEVCDKLDEALALVFPKPADRDRFPDSDGYDCGGIGPSGYDNNGYDIDGFNAEGFNERGYHRNGADKDGFDIWGRHVVTGLTRQQWADRPENLATLILQQGPDFASAVKAHLGDPTDAD